MRLTIWLAMAAIALAILAFAPVSASESISMKVLQDGRFEPANVFIQVRVPQDASNATIRVQADSGAYFSSSENQLDGADAASLNEFEFEGLPAGTYEIKAFVVDAKGHLRGMTRDVIIISARAGR